LRRVLTLGIRDLSKNAKIVIPTGTELINIIGEMAGGIVPIDIKPKTK